MYLLHVWVAVFSAAFAVLQTRAVSSPQDPVFRAGIRTVAVYATVVDGEGRLVPDLDKSAFRVLDDGREVDISVFSNEPQPITAAVMLDMSNSMAPHVISVRDSTERFVEAVAPGDRATIGTFGEEVSIGPVITGETASLRRVLREELWPGGGTPLWRASLAAMKSLESQSGRRVVLVLTDGEDADWSPRRPSAADVEQQAVAGSFVFYAIGMPRTRSGFGGLSKRLRQVVEETGGGSFELEPDADLGGTFARVAEELRRQYLLGFSPRTLDGKTHKLEVQVNRPGCKVRARRSYVAKGDQ